MGVGPLTLALISLLALFGVGDAAAHFTKYKYGETFSAWDRGLEKKHTAFSVVNALILLVLFLHLVLQLF